MSRSTPGTGSAGSGSRPPRRSPTSRPSTRRSSVRSPQAARTRSISPYARRARPSRPGPRCPSPSVPRSCGGVADGIDARAEDLARVETRDNGSLLRSHRRGVMPRVGMNFRFFADCAEQLDHADREIRGHRERITFDPAGRGRDHHAVERAADARHLADRPGARGRQHRRGQAAGVGPAHRFAAGRHRPRGRACRAGVFNVVQGTGAERGRAAHPAPRHQPAVLHRLGADRRARSPRRPRPTSSRSPSSWAASRRCWSSTTADLDLAVDLAVEQFDNAGQVCLGAFRILVHETHRRRVPRSVSSSAPPPWCRATRATRRPTSAPW